MSDAGAALNGTGVARLSALSGGREASWLAVALAALASALTLDVGLATDDYAHRQFVRAHLSEAGAPGAPWDMFDLGGRGGPLDIALRVYSGMLPWWSSAELKVAFFRPLAVATHFVDGLSWPDTPWLMHLHNALWYVGLVALVVAYLRRVIGASVVAGLGGVLYAIDEAHVEGMAWIASRNTLMAAFFAVAALLAHAHAREPAGAGTGTGTRAEGAWRAHVVAALSLAFGLASGEGAIAAWPYLIGHALFVDKSRPASRVLGLLPLAAVTLGWQLVYRSLGYGARGSGVYVDPFSEPRAFASALPGRLATALQELFALPGWTYERAPATWHVALDAACVVLLLLALVPLWRLLTTRAEARMLAFGMLGSLLPVCAIPPAPRLLFVAGVGGAALIAALVVAGLESLRERARHGLAAVAAAAALTAALLLLHAVAAPISARSRALTHADNDRRVHRAAATLPPVGVPGATLVVLDTDNYFLTLLALLQRAWDTPAAPPTASHVLGASEGPVRLTRRSASVLALTPEDGYLGEPWSQLVRSPDERFEPGHSVLLSIGTVTVEAVTRDGRPARLRIELPDPESPALFWVAWDRARGGFARVTLPAVGASLVLGGPDMLRAVER